MPRLTWRKSSYSGSGQDDCVEVAVSPSGRVLYRESDRPAQIARITPDTWSAFLTRVKTGAYDRATPR
ncbi:DUF397 domain-containing protein [Streptomyces sp. NPDC007100]|uniref:DUF397 domain-containing protein n=1 Tax=Streptomyces sp. NPDC007100 TaxID=3155602 RepID=UPI0033C19F0C